MYTLFAGTQAHQLSKCAKGRKNHILASSKIWQNVYASLACGVVHSTEFVSSKCGTFPQKFFHFRRPQKKKLFPQSSQTCNQFSFYTQRSYMYRERERDDSTYITYVSSDKFRFVTTNIYRSCLQKHVWVVCIILQYAVSLPSKILCTQPPLGSRSLHTCTKQNKKKRRGKTKYGMYLICEKFSPFAAFVALAFRWWNRKHILMEKLKHSVFR